MKNKKVLISGAGIAGLTLAYWLKQYGFIPTVVEKHSGLRTEGYKLDIRGTAMEVVKRMGLQDAIFKSRTEIQKALFVDGNGNIVAETTPDLCGARAEGDLEIVRGDLCRILYNQTTDIEYLFGDSIVNISQNENGVLVDFEKNQQHSFDIVVGADGLHSKVRKLAFGDESQFLQELGLFISFYSIPNLLNLDRVEIELHSPKRFVIVYCPRDGMAKAGFAFSSPKTPYDLTDQRQQQKLLQEAFEGIGWEVPRLLNLMNEAPDFYFDCIAQVHMPHWTKGRCALVGDAGYAVSPLAGQGASVALLGAYVLASELAEAQGDYRKAFPSYEECLTEFVKKNQDLVKMSVAIMQGGKQSWITSGIIWLNQKLSRILPASLIQYWKNRGLKQTTKAANSLTLKDYKG